MHAKRGDHICALYSTAAELARTVARFLAEGLSRHERCWYVASGDEGEAVRFFLGRSTSMLTGRSHGERSISYQPTKLT